MNCMTQKTFDYDWEKQNIYQSYTEKKNVIFGTIIEWDCNFSQNIYFTEIITITMEYL